MKAKVINRLKHNGVRYEKGQTFEGEKELVEQLIRDGVLRDKNAAEEGDEVDAQVTIANAKADAQKIVDEATSAATKIVENATTEAEAIKADAQKVAEDTKAAAKAVGEQIVAEAKTKAEAAAKK